MTCIAKIDFDITLSFLAQFIECLLKSFRLFGLWIKIFQGFFRLVDRIPEALLVSFALIDSSRALAPLVKTGGISVAQRIIFDVSVTVPRLRARWVSTAQKRIWRRES